MGATQTAPALAWAAASNQGPRKENQDRVLVAPPNHPALEQRGVLLALCDGVGGEEGGHVAAQAACSEAMRCYYAESATDPQSLLKTCIERSWLAVRNETINGQFARMATTIVLAAIHGNMLYVGHVGDSRAYLFRGGRLRQLTNDHSYVNAQLAAGVITPEEAKKSVYRSVLTRSLGANTDHTPELGSEVLQPGDRVLLCSDGLHGAVEQRLIERILAEQLDQERAASALVGAALNAQTSDNVSVAVLNYGQAVAPHAARAAASAPVAGERAAARKRSPVPALALLVALLGGGAAAAYFSGMIPGFGPGAGGIQPTAATATPASQPATATQTGNTPVPTQPATVKPTGEAATALPVRREAATLAPGAPTATLAPTRTATATATRRPTATRTPVPSATTPPTPTSPPAATVIQVSTAPPQAQPPRPEPPKPPEPPPQTQAPPQPTPEPPAENPTAPPPAAPPGGVLDTPQPPP
jgi:protein phosphatase